MLIYLETVSVLPTEWVTMGLKRCRKIKGRSNRCNFSRKISRLLRTPFYGWFAMTFERRKKNTLQNFIFMCTRSCSDKILKPDLPVPLRVFEDPCDAPDCFSNLDAFMHVLQDPWETRKPAKKKRFGSTTNNGIVIVNLKLMNLLAGVHQRTLQAKYAHLWTASKAYNRLHEATCSCRSRTAALSTLPTSLMSNSSFIHRMPHCITTSPKFTFNVNLAVWEPKVECIFRRKWLCIGVWNQKVTHQWKCQITDKKVTHVFKPIRIENSWIICQTLVT